MAPPIGSEVFVRKTARVTSINDDDSFNIKFDNRPGRPFKVRKHDVVPPSLPLIAAVTAPQPVPAPVGPPCVDAARTDEAPRSRGKRLLGWASAATVSGAVVVGIFHGIGTKLVEIVWPYLHAWFPAFL